METPPKPQPLSADVENCARCGGNHPDRLFQVLDRHPRYTHFAICPATGQPVLLILSETGAE